MPQFEVTAPDGRTATIEGPEAPSEAELEGIFSPAAQTPANGQQSTRKANPVDMVGLFEGVDKMDDALGRTGANELNTAVKGQTDVKLAKMKAANVAFLSQQFGVGADVVAGNLEQYRKNYVSQAMNLTADMDDSTFYSSVGAHLRTQKEEQNMLAGAAGMIYQDARGGKSFNESFAAWKEANRTTPGFNRLKEEYYRDYASKTYDFFRQNAERLSQPIDRVTAHMASLKKGAAPGTEEAVMTEHQKVQGILSTLSPDDQELVLDFAAGAAVKQTAGKDEKMTGIEKASRRVERGLDSFLGGLGRAAEVANAKGEDFRQNPTLGGLLRTVAGAAPAMFGAGQAAGEAGPEETRVRDLQSLNRKLVQRMTGEVDPLKGSTWISNGIMDAAESMPRMLVMLTPPGIAANLVATKQDIAGRYEDQGMSAGQADLLSGFAAPVYTALDFVSSKMVFKGKLPGIDKLLTAPVTSAAGLAGRTGIRAVGGMAEQFTQETLQDLTEPTVQSIASLMSDAVPEVEWGKEFASISNSAPETFAALLPLVIIGTAAGSFKDRSYGQEYLKNREALEAVGFTASVVESVLEAPTPEDAGAIVQENWSKREEGTQTQKTALQTLNEEAMAAREAMGQGWTKSGKAIVEKYPDVMWHRTRPGEIPIEIKRKDGAVVPAVISGWIEYPARMVRYPGEGDVIIPSIAFWSPESKHPITGDRGSWSHTTLAYGEEIVTPIPTAEQWAQGIREVADRQFQYTVFDESMRDAKGRRVVQVDDISGGGDGRGSYSLDTLRKEGVELPDIPDDLPAGQYTEQQIRERTSTSQAVNITKSADGDFVVTDKASSAVIGTAPTPEGAAQIIQDRNKDREATENGPTSTKNAVVDREREKRGLPKAMEAGKREFGTVWDEATRRLDANPTAASSLVKTLLESPRAVTDTENALLLQRQIELQNRFDTSAEALIAAQESGDTAAIEEATAEAKETSDALLDLYTVNKLVGTETGRGLSARRMMANEDFTLARMEVRRRAANEGKPLTKEQQAETKELFEQITALQKELATLKAARDESVSQTDESPETPRKRQRKAPPGKVMGFISKQAAEARKRIKERLAEGRAQSGLDPLDLADHAIVGAELIAKGVTKFADWSASMVKEFGARIEADLADIFDRARDIKKLQDIEARADMRIEELKRQIALEEVGTASKSTLTSESIEEKRKEIADLTKRVESLREQYRPEPPTPQEKAVERRGAELDKQIAKIEKQIADNTVGTESKAAPFTAPELAEREARLAALKEERKYLRESGIDPLPADEKKLAALKTRQRKQIAELERRLDEGDFEEEAPRTPLERDEAADRLAAQIDLLKLQYEAALEKDRYDRMSAAGKAASQLVSLYDSARNIMLSGDLGYLWRQGGLTFFSRPGTWAKAIPDTLKAIAADKVGALAINKRILDDPLYPEAKAAKLALSEFGASLRQQEEYMIGKYTEKTPILRNINQAGVVFLNRIRFDSWKALRGMGGVPTPESDRAFARLVNETTGRGSLPGFEKAAVGVARIGLAPRFVMSRFQYALGNSLWQAPDARSRLIIASEYARTAVGLGALYGLVKFASEAFYGDDDENKPTVETDPRSADFGKVKVGSTRYDPLSGIAQAIVFMSRLWSGEKKSTDSGKITDFTGDDIWRFGRSKLNAIPAAAENLRTGEDLGGNEAKVFGLTDNFPFIEGELTKLFFPITYREIINAYQKEDADEATVAAALMMMGVGVQRYRDDEEREEQRLRRRERRSEKQQRRAEQDSDSD